jgi:hypothetical protein
MICGDVITHSLQIQTSHLSGQKRMKTSYFESPSRLLLSKIRNAGKRKKWMAKAKQSKRHHGALSASRACA